MRAVRSTDFEFLRRVDRLLPVLFLLIDLEQELERRLRVRSAFELAKKLFGAIEQARLQIILRELE